MSLYFKAFSHVPLKYLLNWIEKIQIIVTVVKKPLALFNFTPSNLYATFEN